jgi:hypothetical protein
MSTNLIFELGMAANPLVSSKAASVFGIEFSYLKWVLGALAPALVCCKSIHFYLYTGDLRSSRFSTMASSQRILSATAKKSAEFRCIGRPRTGVLAIVDIVIT